MMQKLRPFWTELENILWAGWSFLSGIISSIAALFGYRPARPAGAHENIAAEDVDNALENARADQSLAETGVREPALDAALDLIWHYVNAPEADRLWIDLSALDEKQRTWLLSLPDREISRLALVGRMATIEAALIGKPHATRGTGSSGKRRRALETPVEALPLSSKAELAREQLVLRLVRGRRDSDRGHWPVPEIDDPAPVEATVAGHPLCP